VVPAPASGLREAGIRTGTAVLRHAPDILETVQASIAPEVLEQVDVLIRVMAGFDRATAEHLESVGTMAMLLAHRVGLSPEVVAACLLAGRVHDIGKLAISRGLLLKPGPPTKTEWAELKLRPTYGASTLNGLPRLKHLAPIVVAHHEHVNGRGYPNGIAGAEIPIESQIAAIADAFCAMTTPRPYSATTRLPNDAIFELQRCAGTQFNADLVVVFADMFRKPDILAV
jgi:HD-GYP domain-containing protein (c-di-GMP phosphodiesterase class II)